MARKKSPSSLDARRDTQANVSIAPRLVTIKQAASYCSCSVWAIPFASPIVPSQMPPQLQEWDS